MGPGPRDHNNVAFKNGGVTSVGDYVQMMCEEQHRHESDTQDVTWRSERAHKHRYRRAKVEMWAYDKNNFFCFFIKNSKWHIFINNTFINLSSV